MMQILRCEIDGRAPTVAELHTRALLNYGHFTAMQVRGTAARGLSLHLDRLDSASRELFGVGVDPRRIRNLVRSALDGIGDASVRIDVHQLSEPGDLSIMVTVRAPVGAPSAATRLRTVRFERPVAHLKHVGTFGQIYHGLQAERAGYDDALLLSPDGEVVETTIANTGVCTARTVVWPRAAVLEGVAMSLVDRHLPSFGFRSEERVLQVDDLLAADAVFTANSTGISAVASIDDRSIRQDASALAAVIDAYAAAPFEPL